jgi:Xaa-Pro dipeptidase
MRTIFKAALILIFAFILMSAKTKAETPAERVASIQTALKEAKLDGWLFYDFRMSDPLAYRILKLEQKGITTRRWFYYVPAQGEPVKLVHSIERDKLDDLPGKKVVFLPWPGLHASLRETLTGSKTPKVQTKKAIRIAMQYSPDNSIPYISRVDAGTVELIRSFGITVVTSADLVQRFEAVWTPEQKMMHIEAADKIHQIIMQTFAEIGRRIKANIPTNEYDIQQFIMRRYEEEGMTCNNEPPIVAVNANSANPHYEPTSKVTAPIKRGDFVLLDVWAKLKKPKAVYADETWTGYVGESVPAEHMRIFNIVKEARDKATEFVRQNIRMGKSIKGADVDDVSRGVIVRAGYGPQFIHRTGHSIGEEVHGNGAHIDNLETKDSRHIIPYTCFSIEPGIYLEGKFGVRSEIDVYVGDREIEVTGQPIQMEVVPILAIK